jgi:hypothetical protein
LQGDAPFSHSLQPRSTYAAIDQQLFEQWRQYLAEAVE